MSTFTILYYHLSIFLLSRLIADREINKAGNRECMNVALKRIFCSFDSIKDLKMDTDT